jgi:hypothetical protein
MYASYRRNEIKNGYCILVQIPSIQGKIQLWMKGRYGQFAIFYPTLQYRIELGEMKKTMVPKPNKCL